MFQLFGIWTLALINCTQVPLLCPGTINLTSNGATITWKDVSNTTLVTQSLHNDVTLAERDYPYNVYLGVEYDITSKRTTSITHTTDKVIHIADTTSLLSSQRITNYTIDHTFSLSTDGTALIYQIASSMMPTIDLTYTYTQNNNGIYHSTLEQQQQQQEEQQHEQEQQQQSKESPKQQNTTLSSTTTATSTSTVPAYNYNVTDAWDLNDPKFQHNAMVISLQGLANRLVSLASVFFSLTTLLII